MNFGSPASRSSFIVPVIGNQLASQSVSTGFGGMMTKHLVGMFLCLIGIVAAQQGGESKPPAPPGVQPAANVLVRAMLAADKARNKQEAPSTEDLKRVIDREIAKSVALPATQTDRFKSTGEGKADDLMVVIDGAVYLKFGGTVYPMPGGGASGCFDPNSSARVEQARLKYAEQNKSEPGKKE
jgi:hypothetical protein